MQFTVIAATLFAAAASALPQVGPVVSGGSCSAESTAAHIPINDCLDALKDLRARGDKPLIACDFMFREQYNYVKKGACQVVTVAHGNPQCMNPKDVADGLEQIISLCGKGKSIIPGEFDFFQLEKKVRVVAAKN